MDAWLLPVTPECTHLIGRYQAVRRAGVDVASLLGNFGRERQRGDGAEQQLELGATQPLALETL